MNNPRKVGETGNKIGRERDREKNRARRGVEENRIAKRINGERERDDFHPKKFFFFDLIHSLILERRMLLMTMMGLRKTERERES